jgi:hypothetical protein
LRGSSTARRRIDAAAPTDSAEEQIDAIQARVLELDDRLHAAYRTLRPRGGAGIRIVRSTGDDEERAKSTAASTSRSSRP